jgi:Bacterial Ig-like domain
MRRMAVLQLASLAALALLASCAKVGAPPGGPEDKTAPTILAGDVRPPQNAAGVAPDSVVSIVFSENPDHRSVMRALAVFPRVYFRRSAWHGDTLSLAPDSGWARNRNTIIRIGPTARDRRNNPLQQAFVLRFTTKAVADSGTIQGHVWAGKERTASAQLVVFASPADTSAGPGVPATIADADKDGNYTLEGLDTGASWRVSGLIDVDGDARPGAVGEVTGTSPEVVSFASGTREAKATDFLVGSLDSLGHVTGEVKADSGSTVIVVARDVVTGEERLSAPVKGSGSYSVTVPTGAHYRMSAFVDVDGNGKHDEGEPVTELAEEVRLELTAERDGISFDLRSPPQQPAKEGP